MLPWLEALAIARTLRRDGDQTRFFRLMGNGDLQPFRRQQAIQLISPLDDRHPVPAEKFAQADILNVHWPFETIEIGMVYGYTTLVAMHEHEGGATDRTRRHDAKSPGHPSCQYRFTASELTVEANDIARLEETPNVFPQHFRVNAVRR
jgi:hypothetical protein